MNRLSSLHTDILVQLRLVAPYGLPLENKLLTDLRAGGYRGLALPTLETALRDLADHNLAAVVEGTLKTTWRITALGVSTLSEEGL